MEKERNKELRNQTKYRELVANLDFCEDALAVATGAKEKVMEDVRREIEQQTREHFLNMIWKEKTYANVEIGDDYNVSVKHVSGCESIGTLSAGERQVLALSFVAALNNVSGFDAPLIIDTPLGRISSEPRTRIAKALPSCFPNRQVILLMTDEEYTPMVRDALKDHVSKEFSIKFTEYKDGSDAKVIENA
jgi:DNA sulfur modification protein DndD